MRSLEEFWLQIVIFNYLKRNDGQGISPCSASSSLSPPLSSLTHPLSLSPPLIPPYLPTSLTLSCLPLFPSPLLSLSICLSSLLSPFFSPSLLFSPSPTLSPLSFSLHPIDIRDLWQYVSSYSQANSLTDQGQVLVLLMRHPDTVITDPNPTGKHSSD